MRNSVQKFWSSGTLFIWLCGAGVGASLLMVGGLLLLITINGLGYFWPHDLLELTLEDGSRVIGELSGREVIPQSKTAENPGGRTRIRLKVGNRDLYGLDFRWVDEDAIVSRATPPDAVALERREWGNFYGRVKEVRRAGETIAAGGDEVWDNLLSIVDRANETHDTIRHIEKGVIGDINYEIEQARLEIQEHKLEGSPDAPEIDRLEARIEELRTRYQTHVTALEALYQELHEHSVLLVDANGRQKELAAGQIIQALRPNSMGMFSKAAEYVANVWTVLTDEPREANTEGGIFPAIFGTVMMVLIMSVVVVPFGVLAAFYLREYAKQGLIVKVVRIAVNNLAGVPSIVFGVFGLGFFVYAVGGTIDALFYPEAFPNPTFGTGGLLWASLTLALMTVPVVIVATEEGLSAVPREYREGAVALGATKFESMFKVILPCAMPGILTGLILAVARATGEVAPLMLTGVVKLAPALPVDGHFPFLHLDRKFMHLGFHIYDVGFQSPNVEAAKPMVYVTTLILVAVVILLNLSAIALRNYMRKKYRGSAV